MKFNHRGCFCWQTAAPREHGRLRCIILSPGPGHPGKGEDFGMCVDALQFAERQGIPLLGVCLGHQGIAHHFGGKVIHAPNGVMHGRISEVEVRFSRLEVGGGGGDFG